MKFGSPSHQDLIQIFKKYFPKLKLRTHKIIQLALLASMFSSDSKNLTVRLVITINCYTSSEKAMAPHSSTLAWKIPWTETWLAAVHGFAKSQTRLSDFTFTFHFHALEKEMATHSSVLAWRIPGTGEPGGLPSVGSHGVGHN